MARYVSSGDIHEDIQHYQKKLVPLNIFVCVLCMVSIITMMFVPFLRIDISKIISNDELLAYIQDTLNDSLSSNTAYLHSASVGSDWVLEGDDDPYDDYDTDNGSGSSSADDLISTLTGSIITPVLKKMGEADISINLTAFSAMKVLIGGGEAFKKEITAIVTKFTSGIVDAVMGLFDNGAIVDMVVDDVLPSVVDAGIQAIKDSEDVPPEVKQFVEELTPEEIEGIKTSIKNLTTTTTPEEFEDVIVDEVAPFLMTLISGETLDDEAKAELREELHTMIQDTIQLAADSGLVVGVDYEFNLESFLCIQLSQVVDFENLDKLFSGLFGDDSDSDPSGTVNNLYAAASPLADDGEDEGEGSGNGNKIFTSFGSIVSEMGGTTDALMETVNTAISTALEGLDDVLDIAATGYGAVFIVVAVFMGLWFILFLFSLLHIFAKNKRFMMWYVKMLCWIPGIFWLAITLAGMPSVVGPILGGMDMGVPVGVITGVISGISMWGFGISYICYWLLWLVSIFWAFPIKHKIRKLNKQAKREAKDAKREAKAAAAADAEVEVDE